MIPAANRIEAQVTFVIDVCHHDPDLVDMPREHEPGRAIGIQRGKGVAAHIGVYRIGELCGFCPPHPRGSGLERRGARCVE
jgi:hypothetical protein